MDFKHFVAADGWFYKVVPHKDVIEAGGRPVIHRVAVWALTADGNIIGLTAATSTAPVMEAWRLCAMPPVDGFYFHQSDQEAPRHFEEAEWYPIVKP